MPESVESFHFALRYKMEAFLNHESMIASKMLPFRPDETVKTRTSIQMKPSLYRGSYSLLIKRYELDRIFLFLKIFFR